ncbi:hypothetical protein SAMN02745947_05491 [Rhodococcus rhodochrous J3]|uniref:Excreted virulence factor EspC, type VII ESX diderm n=1 Tax=Rhodococcus rhodochrous J3 TaxID=903528 RepID=A0ABY1MLP3_RHORH|nr:hypothetical protein [Rhodococcus rhodochrous]MCD2099971.1 hypothetical protein [Rhodococcus rhodochrous]MCD2124369.1 hypothetical protein [Rhodococcus rhodochrous]MDJ0021093.1 hypothetical protein [Rhodococcus rhodochrous]SMG59765.1 hypothetical protein SAMN02745947_05491 [Rhodococcus rhodochrous J3]
MTSPDLLSTARTITDLAAVRDADDPRAPGPATDLGAGHTSATRALWAVVPYAERTGATPDDLESVLADLTADLRHLVDRLGTDWHEITRRAQGYYGDETDGTDQGPAPARPPAAPELEVLVVRDPDGPSEIEAFLDGVPVRPTEYVLDAGAGWHWEDWTEARDANLATASPAARAALLRHYDDPPGGQYVEDRDDAPWIDSVPAAVVDGAAQ